ncbi:MAG: hypothetical protein HUU01_07080 [Saprospiraceae bacterium]|nr:hypothetical protein [Saprospiraceae bacterium]
MKAFQKFALNVLFLFAFTNLAVAGGVPRIEIRESANAKKVSVELEKLNTPATITLEDADGNVLIEERSNGKSFAKTFNLSKLETGDYRLIVNAGLIETVQPLIITGSSLVLDENNRQEIYAPIINVGDNYVDLSFLNKRLSNVIVVFLNESDEVIFQENISNSLKVEKRYNLSRLPKGDYSVKVIAGNGDFHKAVALR